MTQFELPTTIAMILKNNIKNIIYTFLFLLSLSNYSLAQDEKSTQWDNSFNEGVSLNKTREYKNALASFEKAYEIGKEVFSPKSFELINTSYLLASAYHRTKNLNKAIEF